METPATWKSRSQCGNYGQGQRAFQALQNELSKSPLANASSRYVYVQVLRTLQIGRRPRVDDSGRESLRTLASEFVHRRLWNVVHGAFEPRFRKPSLDPAELRDRMQNQ
jgi:hypothetical protein